MWKYYFIVIAMLALLTGCSGSVQKSRDTLNYHVNQVQIGMTQDEVMANLGRPGRTHHTVNAFGTTDIWTYTENDLANNLLNSSDQFAYGMARGAQEYAHGKSYRFWTYIFQNGRLFSMSH